MTKPPTSLTPNLKFFTPALLCVKLICGGFLRTARWKENALAVLHQETAKAASKHYFFNRLLLLLF
jgi:hypothetical protein